MAFFGSALTIVATAQLFFSEIEHRTALTLLAKPVRRGEFVVGKLLGVFGLIGLFCGSLTVLLMAVLWWREGELVQQFPDAFPQGRTIDFANVALAGAFQWLKLAVLSAFTLLVATFAQTQLFAVITGFLILVIGHLQHLAQEAYLQGGTWLGRIFALALAAVFPNFQLFTLADSLMPADAPAWADVLRVGLYGVGYIVAGCALAVFSFRAREI
jgi:ABC-type Na+ efflux pump permease subunit